MEQFQGQTVRGQVVEVDGKHFQNCHLIDCELQFSGGVFVLMETSITNCTWAFGGAAQRTLRLVSTLNLPVGDQFKDKTADVWPRPIQVH
jgi:hypothetical protein